MQNKIQAMKKRRPSIFGFILLFLLPIANGEAACKEGSTKSVTVEIPQRDPSKGLPEMVFLDNRFGQMSVSQGDGFSVSVEVLAGTSPNVSATFTDDEFALMIVVNDVSASKAETLSSATLSAAAAVKSRESLVLAGITLIALCGGQSLFRAAAG